MKDEVDTLSCRREADLIGFLYNEMGDTEKSDFQRHLRGCAECSDQFAAFTDVRAGITTWRNETILQTAPQINAAQFATEQKPSALAALREFFSLSPVWLKGAVAVVSLLFCLLAGFAVLRFRDTANPNVATNQPPPATGLGRVEKPQPQEKSSVVAEAGPPVREPATPPVRPRRQQVAVNKGTRPLSKVERQELAADLRLIEPGTEGDLELLSDRINQ